MDSVGHFVYGLPLEIEETREYEFKEVSGKSPCDAIANTADEYAVLRRGKRQYVNGLPPQPLLVASCWLSVVRCLFGS